MKMQAPCMINIPSQDRVGYDFDPSNIRVTVFGRLRGPASASTCSSSTASDSLLMVLFTN